MEKYDDESIAVTAKNYIGKIFSKNSYRLGIKQTLCFGLILLFLGGTFAFSGQADQAQPLFGIKSNFFSQNYLADSQTENGKLVTWTEYARLADQTTSMIAKTPLEEKIHVKPWATWKIPQGNHFYIDVLSSPELTDQRMQAIDDVLFSKETLDLDGKTLYKGWSGAISSIKDTKFPTQVDLRSVKTYDGTGHILIQLTNLKDPDGYVAYTKLVSDKDLHELVQSKIVFYGVQDLSTDDFKKVLRHELGHAFGLSHSGDPDDLMYEIIKTSYPYISKCDIQTIAGLYNGSEESWVSCEA